MPDFLAREENFMFDFDLSNGYIYDMKINGIKIKQLDILNHSVKVLPGSKFPTLHAEVSNVAITGLVTGGLQVGPYQLFNFTDITISGLKVSIDLGIIRDANNTAYWQIQGTSSIDFDDLHMSTDSIVLNTALEIVHGILVIYLKTQENGYGAFVNQLVSEYNLLLRARSTFFVPYPDTKHHRLNATVSVAPEFDADTQLCSVAIDGTIFDSYLKTSHVQPTTTKANRVMDFAGN